MLYASHNDFQQTNAVQSFISEGTQGVTESLKGRMILPITGSYGQFIHVLTHEMVHAINLIRDVVKFLFNQRANPLQEDVMQKEGANDQYIAERIQY